MLNKCPECQKRFFDVVRSDKSRKKWFRYDKQPGFCPYCHSELILTGKSLIVEVILSIILLTLLMFIFSVPQENRTGILLFFMVLLAAKPFLESIEKVMKNITTMGKKASKFSTMDILIFICKNLTTIVKQNNK